MSDYDDNDDFATDDATDEQKPESTRNDAWRRKLEAEAKEGRQAKAEIAAAKRELAFIKAGIDLDTPQGKLLAKAYDGDPTPDAVKAFAIEHGALTPEAPAVPQDELAAHDRFAAASAGATSQTDEQAYFSDLENAQSEQDVLAILARAGGELIDSQSRITRWERGGQHTPSTTPIER